MKHYLFLVFSFLNSVFFSISVIQQWNLINSAIDLLPSSDSASINITVIDETINGFNIYFYKHIAKDNGEVGYKKYLRISRYEIW